MWWVYAILSALFASLTAIFGKLELANINSNLATGIRTVVILVMIWIIILTRGEAKGINTLSKQNITFLVVSGIATGLSWLFYFKALQLGNVSQVAPIDKLSVALTIILAMIFRRNIDIENSNRSRFNYYRDFGNDCIIANTRTSTFKSHKADTQTQTCKRACPFPTD